jgi:Ca2+-binding EF-hand superfamily protein
MPAKATAKGNLKQEIALAKQREAEVRSVFEKYDVDGSCTIEMDELTALLEDLGLLQNLRTSVVEFAAEMFSRFDKNDDVRASPEHTGRPALYSDRC